MPGQGRDVIFNTKIVNDPGNAAVLKKFADDFVKTWKTITGVANQEFKKQADEYTKVIGGAIKSGGEQAKTQAKRTKEDRTKSVKDETLDVLKIYKDAETSDYKFRRDLQVKRIGEERAAEANLSKQIAKDRIDALKHVQSETKRMNRELERNITTATRQTAIDRRNETRRDKRVEHAYGHVIGGLGEVARGAAYTGLIGQDNTQTVLNTVAGVTGAASLYTGGKRLAGALGTVASGGTATGGAAIAAGLPIMGAAVTALVAWLPTLAGAVKGAAIAIKGSSSTHKGDVAGGFFEGIAGSSIYAIAARNNSTEQLEKINGRGDTVGVHAGLELSNRRLAAQQEASQRRAGILSGMNSNLSALGASRRESIQGNLGAARSQFREAIGDFQNLQNAKAPYEAQKQAAETVRQLQGDILNIVKEQQATAVAAAKTQYDLLHAAADEAKRMYADAKSAVGSDLSKFAHASPEEKMRLQEIKRKQAAGEELTEEESATASGYNEFRDLAQSNQERIAKQHGAGDIFTSGLANREKTEKDMITAGKAAAEAKLTLDQKLSVQVEITDDNFKDEVMKEFESKLEEIKGMREKDQKDLKDLIRGAIVQYANSNR